MLRKKVNLSELINLNSANISKLFKVQEMSITHLINSGCVKNSTYASVIRIGQIGILKCHDITPTNINVYTPILTLPDGFKPIKTLQTYENGTITIGDLNNTYEVRQMIRYALSSDGILTFIGSGGNSTNIPEVPHSLSLVYICQP